MILAYSFYFLWIGYRPLAYMGCQAMSRNIDIDQPQNRGLS